MIGKTKIIRTQKIWKETLDKIDALRDEINKNIGFKPPRTEVLNAWANSGEVKQRTLNSYKRRVGLL